MDFSNIKSATAMKNECKSKKTISGKERFINMIAAKHPEESKEMLELAWHFHSMDKAKRYNEILGCCNSYADIASKAIREMFVEGDIDSQKAVNTIFIKALLPFTNLERDGVPHSVVYHIKKVLEDKDVLAERRTRKERQQMDNEIRTGNTPVTVHSSHYLLTAEDVDLDKLMQLQQMAIQLGVKATVSEVIIPAQKGDISKHYRLAASHKLKRRIDVHRNDLFRIQFVPDASETKKLITVPILPLSTEVSLSDISKRELQISVKPYKHNGRMLHHPGTVIIRQISTIP